MAPDWLTSRPIAHRGLHDVSRGILENCPMAFNAAIANGYAIECDVQLTSDGEAMVFHDETVDRLTTASGRVDAMSATALQALTFRATTDRMEPLSSLFARTAGRVPLVVEIKSEFDGRMTLTERVAALAADYAGPLALMSFDPAVIAWLKTHAPALVRGIVAESTYAGTYWSHLPAAMKPYLANLAHYPETEPHFLSWKVADLPSAATVLYRHALDRPVICWTVRTDEDRVRAARYADQVTFEGYRA